MPLDLRELQRVKSLRYDPSNPTTQLFWRDPRQRIRFHIGKIVDNKDPEKMGRVKLEIKIYGDSALTDWVPVARPFAGPDMGFFTVPELNTMVIVAFVNDNFHQPVVLGNVYGQPQDVKAPIASNPDNDIKKFTSKSGMEIVLNDKKGEEQIVIRTKDGKMELNLTKAGGVTIKNELGDVKLDCDTFFMESGKDAIIKAEKSATFEAESIVLKSSKGVSVKSSGNVVVKGSKIKLKGSGITAEMKQIAVKGDMIVGVDNHQVKIPTQSGPQPGPVLPHPFVGDLKDKLSKDVVANNKAVATKGSKGKTKVHIQMPPGIMFNKQPDKIGIVDKGCIDSVKVNGKAVAVLLAECKTCNDPGPTAMMPAKVLAFGTAISFPANMLGLDPNKYKSSDGNVRMNSRSPMAGAGAGNNGNRGLSNPQWSSSAVSVGSEVKLSCSINSYPNAMVHFKIWKAGANFQTDTPIKEFKITSASGRAEAKWTYRPEETKIDTTDDAGPISSIMGIQRRLTRLNYQLGRVDGVNGPRTKAAVRKFQADNNVTVDGSAESQTQGKLQEKYAEYIQQQRQNNAIDKPKFIFTADSHDCSQIQSSELEIGTKIKLTIKMFENEGLDITNELSGKLKVRTPDGQERLIDLSADLIEIDNIPPGEVILSYTESSTNQNNNNNSTPNQGTQTNTAQDTNTNNEQNDQNDPIEIELLDDEGKPMANERYTVVDKNGQVLASGNLDANGKAKVTNISITDYTVQFPDVQSKGEIVGENS